MVAKGLHIGFRSDHPFQQHNVLCAISPLPTLSSHDPRTRSQRRLPKENYQKKDGHRGAIAYHIAKLYPTFGVAPRPSPIKSTAFHSITLACTMILHVCSIRLYIRVLSLYFAIFPAWTLLLTQTANGAVGSNVMTTYRYPISPGTGSQVTFTRVPLNFENPNGYTLSQVFGPTNASGLIPGFSSSADKVWVTLSDGQYLRCYYSSGGLAGVGWRSIGGGSTNEAHRVLGRNPSVLFIERIATPGGFVQLTGPAPLNPVTTKLSPGTNYVCSPAIKPVTLQESGLEATIRHPRMNDAGPARGWNHHPDIISIPTGVAGVYDKYYLEYSAGNGVWRKMLGAGPQPVSDPTNHGSVLLPALFLFDRPVGTFSNPAPSFPTFPVGWSFPPNPHLVGGSTPMAIADKASITLMGSGQPSSVAISYRPQPGHTYYVERMNATSNSWSLLSGSTYSLASTASVPATDVTFSDSNVDSFSTVPTLYRVVRTDARFITPGPDPVWFPKSTVGNNQNEFCFSGSTVGTCTIALKYRINPSPGGTFKFRLPLTNTSGTTVTWSSSPPDGTASVVTEGTQTYLVATATLTGLPIENAYFGKRTAELWRTPTPGTPETLYATAEYEIFFPKYTVDSQGNPLYATNNPNESLNSTHPLRRIHSQEPDQYSASYAKLPNWYYYWSQTGAANVASGTWPTMPPGKPLPDRRHFYQSIPSLGQVPNWQSSEASHAFVVGSVGRNVHWKVNLGLWSYHPNYSFITSPLFPNGGPGWFFVGDTVDNFLGGFWNSFTGSGEVNRGPRRTGIDCFAATMVHEYTHCLYDILAAYLIDDINGPAGFTGADAGGWNYGGMDGNPVSACPNAPGLDLTGRYQSTPDGLADSLFAGLASFKLNMLPNNGNPPQYFEFNHLYEVPAVVAEQDVVENTFSREDWAFPGKNHGVLNKHDD